MQSEMARYNSGWNHSEYDFEIYLRLSSNRFYRAYRYILGSDGVQSVCDVGGFWGILAMILKQLGSPKVFMTESLKYYSNAFDGLFNCISNHGVEIIDFDPFEKHEHLPGKFDIITLMAVLEHYPHSLSIIMRNIRDMLEDDGTVYLEVPNIAYWPKRVDLLFGKTPLPTISSIYRSQIPFIGHHHEFTIYELYELALLSKFQIYSESYYTYSVNPYHWKYAIRHPVHMIMDYFRKRTRECISVVMKRT